jgi:hypothetical protein
MERMRRVERISCDSPRTVQSLGIDVTSGGEVYRQTRSRSPTELRFRKASCTGRDHVRLFLVSRRPGTSSKDVFWHDLFAETVLVIGAAPSGANSPRRCAPRRRERASARVKVLRREDDAAELVARSLQSDGVKFSEHVVKAEKREAVLSVLAERKEGRLPVTDPDRRGRGPGVLSWTSATGIAYDPGACRLMRCSG